MECSSVLEKFLLRRSDFDEIISFNKFVSFFPKATSIELIRDLYQGLIEERSNNCMEHVKNAIRNEYNIPFESLIGDANFFSSIVLSRNTIEELMSRLYHLSKVSKDRLEMIDESNKQQVAHINDTILILKKLSSTDESHKIPEMYNVLDGLLDALERAERILSN